MSAISITYAQAVDEIFALFLANWNANTVAIVGTVPEVRWQGIESPNLPDLSAYWARVSTQMVREGQASIGAGQSNGKSMYESAGLVFVQCFAPMTDAKAMEDLRLLASLARNSFRGQKTPSGVWFRNARVQELSPEDKFQRMNAVAEFQYNEIA